MSQPTDAEKRRPAASLFRMLFLFFLFGELGVVPDALGVIVILKPVDELGDLGHGLLVGQLGGAGGHHGALGGQEKALKLMGK